MASKTKRENAQQTFRQFAWNLAGTLSERQSTTQGQRAHGSAGSGSKR